MLYRGRQPAARRAGLEFVEKLLTRHSKDRELSGLGAYVTHRYQDVRGTPLSVGGVDRDSAAVSGRVGEVQAGVPVTEVAERHS